VNWGKEIQLMDLSQTENQRWLHEKIHETDIVLANFRPDSARRLGLDYATLQAFNPRLVYGEITGYGEDDPRPAFDMVLQAEAGFLYMTGEQGGTPAKLPVALIDLLAAHQLKEGILLALLQRAQTGQGSRVSVSLFDAALASLANQATNWLVAGKIPQRMGSLHPNIAPYGEILVTKEGGQIVLAVGNDRQFQNLCKVLGLEALAHDPAYSDNGQRVIHRSALYAQLQAQAARFEREDLLQNLHAHAVPAGAVRDLQEVFSLPQAQDLILNWNLPDGQEVKSVRSAVFTIRAV
jgi:crotonobetainyl-CoA:carnitine CoA-transferase CaiB-like acyl-CoA transferase